GFTQTGFHLSNGCKCWHELLLRGCDSDGRGAGVTGTCGRDVDGDDLAVADLSHSGSAGAGAAGDGDRRGGGVAVAVGREGEGADGGPGLGEGGSSRSLGAGVVAAQREGLALDLCSRDGLQVVGLGQEGA